MNSLMAKWFRLLIQWSIHKMNNPTVKLDLDSIIKCWFAWLMNKIYLYLLPFSYLIRLGFSSPLIKITARIDRLQTQREGSKSTNHRTYTDFSETVLFSKRSGLLHWLLATKWRTVCLGWTSELARTRPLTIEKKRRKNKILWSTCGKCTVFQKTVIESTLDFGIEGKYEYLIVHFMNGLLNQGTKSFFRQYWIHWCVRDGNAWPGLRPGGFGIFWLTLGRCSESLVHSYCF